MQKAESYLSHRVQIIGDYEPEELYFDESIHLIENGDKISEIKKILDIYIDVVHWIKTFEISESVEKEPEVCIMMNWMIYMIKFWMLFPYIIRCVTM